MSHPFARRLLRPYALVMSRAQMPLIVGMLRVKEGSRRCSKVGGARTPPEAETRCELVELVHAFPEYQTLVDPRVVLPPSAIV